MTFPFSQIRPLALRIVIEGILLMVYSANTSVGGGGGNESDSAKKNSINFDISGNSSSSKHLIVATQGLIIVNRPIQARCAPDSFRGDVLGSWTPAPTKSSSRSTRPHLTGTPVLRMPTSGRAEASSSQCERFDSSSRFGGFRPSLPSWKPPKSPADQFRCCEIMSAKVVSLEARSLASRSCSQQLASSKKLPLDWRHAHEMG